MLNLEIKLYHALVLIWFPIPFLNFLLFLIFFCFEVENFSDQKSVLQFGSMFFFLLDLVVPKFAFKGGGQLGIPFGKGFLEHERRLLAVKINSELK